MIKSYKINLTLSSHEKSHGACELVDALVVSVVVLVGEIQVRQTSAHPLSFVKRDKSFMTPLKSDRNISKRK